MDLTVEISLDLITCKNIVTTINTIKNIIENNNAYYNFSFYETEGCRKIERNEYINSIIFEDKNDLLNFLKEIKFLKNIRIDCIYYSNSIEYLYISKRYAKINNIKNVKSIYNNSLNIENILNIK
tara:strand:- start:124 stop:498 length:375 start_codon:yes stop_codon:yes gene_type:complete